MYIASTDQIMRMVSRMTVILGLWLATQSGHVNSKNFYASVIVDVFKVNCYILCFAHMLHLRYIIILLLSRTKFASLWRGVS